VALRLPEHWLWDFWFARDGGDVHLFHLQAPRSLGDPELRHRNATIGHAVSRDLRTWEVLPPALAAGDPGAFDDLATWTGSVVRHAGRWHLFYTGISRAEDGAVQRVGLATSDDLVSWVREGVVVEADPRWYEVRTSGPREPGWRDAWVQRLRALQPRLPQGTGAARPGHRGKVDERGWRPDPRPRSPTHRMGGSETSDRRGWRPRFRPRSRMRRMRA
jgi:beta-fructofuranosidase